MMSNDRQHKHPTKSKQINDSSIIVRFKIVIILYNVLAFWLLDG